VPSVLVQCDVRCDQPGTRYRVWVQNEMFAERQWCWGQDHSLLEQIAISAHPGKYQIYITGDVVVDQWCLIQGPGQVDQQGLVEIRNEST
jgi:hypothetical protein